jgi:NTE family protein
MVSAQDYTNLVFEGAGTRGLAYAGAIKALEEKNVLQKIDKVGGTSAGAIAALALSLGYSGSEIEKMIYELKLQKFNDGKFFFIGGIARLNRHYGWYRGKAFMKWLEHIIEQKTNDADITFLQLKENGFKQLYVTGTSLNHQKLIIFSHETYPNMCIKDAVRISMSIPLYFEAVLIDQEGRVKSRKEMSQDTDIMVDGGIIGNFPIYIFDSVMIHKDGHTRKYNPHTIGLRIDTPEQILYDKEKKGLAPIPIQRFRNYASAFYNYSLENLNRGSLTEQDWERTISISSGTIGPKIRKLSASEKETLVQNGYTAMKQYLDHHEPKQ